MQARVLLIMTFLLASVNAKAADAKDASHGDEAAPSKAGKAKKPPAAAAAPAGKEPLMSPERSDHYVHRWIEFPSFQGVSIHRQQPITVKPAEGRVAVVVFLASWCVPCQQQIRDFQDIEKKYSDRFTDFYYVFAHDTASDARGFSAVYKLGDHTLLGSAKVLEIFHQPELPSYFVADRYRWLSLRRLNVKAKDLKDLDHFLEMQTAL